VLQVVELCEALLRRQVPLIPIFSRAPAPRRAATSSHPERCARCGAHVSAVPTASGPDAGATAVGAFRRLILLLLSPWLGHRWGGAELLLLCVNCVCISKGFCIASTPTRLRQLATVAWMWLVHIVMSKNGHAHVPVAVCGHRPTLGELHPPKLEQ
jgi:hypothetical protein